MASLPSTASPTLLWIMFSVSLLLISWCEGREFLVGGSEHAWKVPGPSQDWLNQWARTQRFNVGDALIFKYDNMTESVHIVNKEDYLTCTKRAEHTVFKDGSSKLWLLNSGPFHFISGAEGHCQMGLKLAVVVMSPRSHSPLIASSASSSPAPSFYALPPSINQAVAPTSGGVFIPVIMGLGVSLAMIMFSV